MADQRQPVRRELAATSSRTRSGTEPSARLPALHLPPHVAHALGCSSGLRPPAASGSTEPPLLHAHRRVEDKRQVIGPRPTNAAPPRDCPAAAPASTKNRTGSPIRARALWRQHGRRRAAKDPWFSTPGSRPVRGEREGSGRRGPASPDGAWIRRVNRCDPRAGRAAHRCRGFRRRGAGTASWPGGRHKLLTEPNPAGNHARERRGPSRARIAGFRADPPDQLAA